jgi:thiol-disulfide isomerase/thioredoxin
MSIFPSVPAVVLSSFLPLLAQECEPPSPVRAAIAASTLPAGPQNFPDQRIAAARKVRDQFPSDYFAHRFYQEQFFNQGVYAKEVLEEYRALDQSRSGDSALFLLLYARVLTGTNTKEAIRIFNALLARDPANPLAHLRLAEIYSAPAFRDREKVRANVEVYWKACPASLGGFSLVTRSADEALAGSAAPRLRKLLEPRSDDEALSLYQTLWSLEFKAVPTPGHDAVRARVRKDVGKLRSQDLEKHPMLAATLAEGYKILDDAEGRKWAEAAMAKHPQPGGSASAQAVREWHQAHKWRFPYGHRADMELLVNQAGEWIRQWPDDPDVRRERFHALSSLEFTQLDDVVAAAHDWVRVWEAHPTGFEPYTEVIGFYQHHRIRFDEMRGLIDKAVKALPGVSEPPPVSDLYPGIVPQAAMEQQRTLSTLSAASSALVAIKEYDRASEILAQLRAALPQKGGANAGHTPSESAERTYWESMAKLAEGRGDINSYLENKRQVILLNPMMGAYEARQLREVWREAKGTADGFDAWLGLPESAKSAATTRPSVATSFQQNWSTLSKPLPDFTITDAAGKTWRLADLKGKTTFINVWATWCGPCLAELPYVQKLHEALNDRTGLVLITLNVDDNPGLIAPFLKEHHYTFPALPGSTVAGTLAPQLSIPRNWIVDAAGVWREERIGFTAADTWVKDMIGELDHIASTAAPAPGNGNK